MTHKLRGFEPVKKYANKNITLPHRATKHSAGYDVYAAHAMTIPANGVRLISIGVKAYMQPGEVLYAFDRSSNAKRLHIELVNSVGVIDGDYYNNPDNEGEIFLQFRNLTAAPLTIEANTSIGQVVFMPLLLADGDSFENGEERVGGFGSTSK